MIKKLNGSMGMSIRTKITLIFTLMILFSLIVVGLLVSYESKQILLKQAEEYLTKLTNQKSKEYSLSFQRIEGEINSISSFAGSIYARNSFLSDLKIPVLLPWTGETYGNDAVKRTENIEILKVQRIGEMLKSMVSNNPLLSLGYYGSASGIIVFDKDQVIQKIHDIEAFDVTERPWFQRAAEKKTLIWTDPYVDMNTKDVVVTCAVPCYSITDGSLIGVAGLDVLLTTIESDILSLDIGYKSYAFLVDSYGKVLVRPGMTKKNIRWDETYNTADLLNTGNREFDSITEKMVYGESGIGTFTSQGYSKYVSYSPVPIIGASLGIVALKSEVIRPVERVQLVILTILVIVSFIILAVGFIFGNNITKPIKELTNITNMMSQGKMDLQVLPETRRDELGILISSINRLVTSLKIALSRR